VPRSDVEVTTCMEGIDLLLLCGTVRQVAPARSLIRGARSGRFLHYDVPVTDTCEELPSRFPVP